jgi:hypothetical protein
LLVRVARAAGSSGPPATRGGSSWTVGAWTPGAFRKGQNVVLLRCLCRNCWPVCAGSMTGRPGDWAAVPLCKAVLKAGMQRIRQTIASRLVAFRMRLARRRAPIHESSDQP